MVGYRWAKFQPISFSQIEVTLRVENFQCLKRSKIFMITLANHGLREIFLRNKISLIVNGVKLD